MTSVTKTCRRCSVDQPLSEFSKRSVSPDGLHLYCRECVRFLNHEMYLVKKGLLVRAPKVEPLVKTCNRCKQSLPVETFYVKRNGHGKRDSICPACWREYSRERLAANPDAAAARKAQIQRWRMAHPEASAAASARFWAKHADARRAVNKQWQADNPERAKAHRDKRRALKKLATVVRFTPEQLAARMAYFGNACWMCGGNFDEVDHVKPLSKGGLHALSNMRPSCDHCNNTKHARWYGPMNLDRFRKN